MNTSLDEKETTPATASTASAVENVESNSSMNPATVKSLLRKLDMILLPTLAITYLFNSLDRSNLGNAKTAGLSTDIGLVGNQYNLALTFYYVLFILFGPVFTLLTKVFSASVTIPAMMIGFGAASACTAAVSDFKGLLVARIFVGVFESGFLASVVFYLSQWYTHREIAKRISIFYAAAALASGFGGLLAYGVFHITNGALHSWAYLFILEGSLTTIIGIATAFILPKDIQSARFLNAEEKRVAQLRIVLDNAEALSTVFSWSEAISEFKNVHFWIRAFIAITYGLLPNVSANFLPIMTARLGYNVVITNLLTVAPAALATAAVILIAWSSDYFDERGFHMAAAVGCGMVGYIILIAVDIVHNSGVGYFALFLTTMGAYPLSVIYSAWTMRNIPNLNARAASTGVLISICNCGGLVASNIFIPAEAPRYITALGVNIAFAGCAMLACVFYSLYLKYLNRRLDKKYGRYADLPNSDVPDSVRVFRFQT